MYANKISTHLKYFLFDIERILVAWKCNPFKNEVKKKRNRLCAVSI